MLGILSNWKIILAGAAVALILSGAAFVGGVFYGEGVQKTTDQVGADRLKIAADKELQLQTMKTKAAEESAAAALAQNEKDTRDHEKALADAAARSNAVIAAAGGLRDPGGRGNRGDGSTDRVATAALNNAGAAAGARLSGELTQFLLGEADRADQVVIRLKACESDDATIRGVVAQQGAATE
jgi:hypothetical protein